MARRLASQGHRGRALAIYEELLARNSQDAELREEAEALRRGDRPTYEEPRLPTPSQLPPTEATSLTGEDRIECEGVVGEGLRLRWEVSEAGTERARAVLGSSGELAIRIVTISPDQERVVRSEITEHGPVGPSGQWTTPLADSGSRGFASIGLRADDRFVSIVHART